MGGPVDLRIGCVGYSYDFWVGPFYPRHTPQADFLRLYSKVFDLFEALRRREVALVWNEVQYLNTTPEITADFVYLRFIGDRSLSDLGRVQIDRTTEMEKWAGRLRSVEDRVARAYVLFNNHFAGFGPAGADQFRRILGLPAVDFAAIHAPERGQKRL